MTTKTTSNSRAVRYDPAAEGERAARRDNAAAHLAARAERLRQARVKAMWAPRADAWTAMDAALNEVDALLEVVEARRQSLTPGKADRLDWTHVGTVAAFADALRRAANLPDEEA